MSDIAILNVEDDRAGREAISALLRKEGFVPIEATTGVEALSLAKTVQPKLVLVHAKLPDVSGYEVCRLLKADYLTAFIPVLQLSGSYISSNDRLRALESGADAYLVKPIESEELMATIKALLRMRDAEDARRESEARYQLLFEGNSLPTWILDLDTLRFLAVNEAAVRHYGISREEFLGMTISGLRPSSDTPALEDYLVNGLQSLANASQWAHMKKDGTIVDVEVVWHELIFMGRHALLMLANDITERRQSRAALAESEERFRMMADTAPVMIWVADTDRCFSFFNKPWLEFTGRTTEQEAGSGWIEGIHPEDRENYLRVYAEAFDRRESFNLEHRLRRQDDRYRWVLNVGVPRSSSDGSFVGYIGSCVDITERKLAEAEREELLEKERLARDEAEAANRAKDEFLAVVSHELRAPLNAMLGWARILRSSGIDENTKVHAIEIIERSARAQSKLIEDLLDTARIVTGKLRLDIKPVDLTSVIQSAIEVLQPAAEAKGIQIEPAFEVERREVITGDAERLQQIVWNLLSNAVKFTPQGGQVEIRLLRVDPHVRIVVSDSGKGIRPDYLPHIFDRFHPADSSSTRRHGGLGLGLSLVKHLVELHGGTVNAESLGDGLGSTFTVDLPLRAVRTPAADCNMNDVWDPRAVGGVTLDGLRVLVVDDELDARELVATLLKQCGAKVKAVSSAQEAFGLLKGGGWLPAVLVSDIGMPDEDGYTLIRRIRELAPDEGGQIPAIALTAYGQPTDRIRALSAGFQMHMPKPVDPAELASVIKSLTGRPISAARKA
ncbi:MAG: hybrid sensor histidine kinase/response regulator [Blastocatellia bacterium AA13]|nr:MAG: hybrid sensor histidine kinase/response regulator [Blastocatellia bacterium AA13]